MASESARRSVRDGGWATCFVAGANILRPVEVERLVQVAPLVRQYGQVEVDGALAVLVFGAGEQV
jgi:hypothetical protein